MRNLLFVAACLLALASCKNAESTDSATDAGTPTAETAAPTTNCYISALGRDTTFVSITISADGTVSGTYDWAPHEQDGAHGTLSGKKENDRLNVIYDYTIEGSNQQQEMQFRIGGEQLFEGKGELEDSEGGLLKIKDSSKLTWQPLVKVECK